VSEFKSSKFEDGRRAYVKLLYNGVNISQSLKEYLISFSYTDNTDDKADDLQIELEDRERNWQGSWYPLIREETTSEIPVSRPPAVQIPGFDDITGGAGSTETQTVTTVKSGSKLTASIIVENWDRPGTFETLPCGTFEIDGMKLKGPPDRARIKGVSVPSTSKLRNQKNSRAWEQVKLSRVATDLATRHGMELSFNSGSDPEYDRLDQLQTADLAYLQQLCRNSGLSLKATGTEIVIFNQLEFESKPQAFTVVKGESYVIDYDFDHKTDDTYSKATTVYRDPKSGQTTRHTFDPEEFEDDERPELIINARPPILPVVQNRPQASHASRAVVNTGGGNFDDILLAKTADTTKKQAQSALRDKNKNENKAAFTLWGDIRAVGGVTFDVKGWGQFDGKYIIESSAHRINTSGGYIVRIVSHKVLGY
jgi:hypothetical protein